MVEWISVDERLPPLDTDVWICVRNKNKEGGIWLYDICSFDGEKWAERNHTWERIVYWAIPVPPMEK